MGHKSRKQKQKQRRLHGDQKRKHEPTKLAWPWWYRCKMYIPGLCGDCPHGELHMVSPAPGLQMCGGLCCHREISVYCVKVRKCRKDEFDPVR